MAVASVLVEPEVKCQCQVCWWEQQFSDSDKCIGGNRSSVAVASVLGRTEVNTLTGHTVGRCYLPDRGGRFPLDINVYAISNFLTSSLVLDIFFVCEIVCN